jgi:hypothetical protein
VSVWNYVPQNVCGDYLWLVRSCNSVICCFLILKVVLFKLNQEAGVSSNHSLFLFWGKSPAWKCALVTWEWINALLQLWKSSVVLWLHLVCSVLGIQLTRCSASINISLMSLSQGGKKLNFFYLTQIRAPSIPAFASAYLTHWAIGLFFKYILLSNLRVFLHFPPWYLTGKKQHFCF